MYNNQYHAFILTSALFFGYIVICYLLLLMDINAARLKQSSSSFVSADTSSAQIISKANAGNSICLHENQSDIKIMWKPIS